MRYIAIIFAALALAGCGDSTPCLGKVTDKERYDYTYYITINKVMVPITEHRYRVRLLGDDGELCWHRIKHSTYDDTEIGDIIS